MKPRNLERETKTGK